LKRFPTCPPTTNNIRTGALLPTSAKTKKKSTLSKTHSHAQFTIRDRTPHRRIQGRPETPLLNPLLPPSYGTAQHSTTQHGLQRSSLPTCTPGRPRPSHHPDPDPDPNLSSPLQPWKFMHCTVFFFFDVGRDSARWMPRLILCFQGLCTALLLPWARCLGLGYRRSGFRSRWPTFLTFASRPSSRLLPSLRAQQPYGRKIGLVGISDNIGTLGCILEIWGSGKRKNGDVAAVNAPLDFLYICCSVWHLRLVFIIFELVRTRHFRISFLSVQDKVPYVPHSGR